MCVTQREHSFLARIILILMVSILMVLGTGPAKQVSPQLKAFTPPTKQLTNHSVIEL